MRASVAFWSAPLRLNRLDLNLLVALDALLTECSITRAATRIHLSQPATSGALSRLREYFGDELLVRIGSEMRPTPLGESLANPVRNILMQIQATVEGGLEFDAQNSDRRFGFLMSDYASTSVMPKVVQHLAHVAPGIRIEFFMATDHPAQELEKGNVDFLLMPEHVISPEHPSEKLFEEEFVCLLCKDHPLTQKSFTLDALQTLKQVVVRFGSNRDMTQDQYIIRQDFGLDLPTDIICSTFNATPQYLPGTHRGAIVYRRLAEEWCRFLPLKILKLPIDLPRISWLLQWHQYRDLDPGIQWMRSALKKIVKD
jgi:LysR family nod box-dependent transcriptional activator